MNKKTVIVKGGEEAIDIDVALELAKKIPTPKVYRPLHEYGEAIHVMLEEKKMSYREISEWFSSHGINHSTANISNAYQKWCALNPLKAEENNQRGER